MANPYKLPSKAGGDRSHLAAIVTAWSSGYTEGMPEGHKKIAREGYSIGLHEGMRYVVELVGEGVNLREAVRRCASRVSDAERRPYWNGLLKRMDADQSKAQAQAPKAQHTATCSSCGDQYASALDPSKYRSVDGRCDECMAKPVQSIAKPPAYPIQTRSRV